MYKPLKSKSVDCEYLQSCDLFQQLHAYEVVSQVVREISMSLELQNTLQLVADRARSLIKADTLAVPMIDTATSSYRYQAASGIDAPIIAGQSLPLAFGMCGWVLTNQRSLLWGSEYPDLMGQDKEWNPGMQSVLLVPLMSRGKIIGGLSCMGKEGGLSFNENDLQLLELFAGHTSIAIENAQIFADLQAQKNRLELSEYELYELNRTLEQRITNRTQELSQSNLQLNEALVFLSRTQDELIRNEKLVSLGAMVAGVAHELNTPIGNAVLIASSLLHESSTISAAFEQKTLSRLKIQRYLGIAQDGCALMEKTLARAAELINNFKQLAVDQTSEQHRIFDLRTVLHEVEMLSHPVLKLGGHQIELKMDSAIQMDSYPGPLGQILINLVNNAVIHAFDGATGKTIRITVESIDDVVFIHVEDNGIGIAADILPKVFDPFFTTKLGQGGSGLGLHIVYSIVTRVLGGKIRINSVLGQGTCFILSLPITVP